MPKNDDSGQVRDFIPDLCGGDAGILPQAGAVADLGVEHLTSGEGFKEKRYRRAGGDTAHGECGQEILLEKFRHVCTDREPVAVHDVQNT